MAVEHDPELDAGICWQAIFSRDPRFDGRFFAGANTTGLYCRNICPVPFARRKNIVIFACAAAAESAGFRPCKRCHPQVTPGTPAWRGTSAVVSRALRLILQGALNDESVEQLSERLGVGSRQLRRLFIQHLGASPFQVATTHRVNVARRLIEESGFPLTEIAFSSGFKSIREYNHAVRSMTGHSPSQLRRASGSPRVLTSKVGLELRLAYRDPYDWKSLISFLKVRATPGVEVITQTVYYRTIDTAGVPGFMSVSPDAAGARLVVALSIGNYDGLPQTVDRIRRIFDVGADPAQIASHLSQDSQLQRLVALRPGLRVPGVWDGFEEAVLAVLGQTLSVRAPTKVVTRLVQLFGEPVDTPISGLNYLFPRPEVLAVADLSKAGIDEACAKTIRKLACCATLKRPGVATSRTLDEVISDVSAMYGMSECTANYIAMRALGEPDAFPSGDVGLRRNLSGPGPILSPSKTTALAEKWRPWRAYAAMHITA
jgi:AraC family transcriptional regulator of adaptative response / DNA-3-methyladenine glycosylase II